jgi:hypothetical protein
VYASLWRLLPGPLIVRILIASVLVIGVVVALVLWVFPWVEQFVIPADVTVDEP